MKKISPLLGIIFGFFVSVSAFGQVAIPIYKVPAKVSVSSASMGAWTEVAAGEYQIANSHVYLFDPSKNTTAGAFIGMLLLGVPGVVAAGAIDIASGQSAASGTGAVYVKKFDQNLSSAVAQKIETDARKMLAVASAVDQEADIVLRPAIRLTKVNEKLSFLTVRVLAAYKDSESGKISKREFQVFLPDQLALAGESDSWAGENGKAFMARANEGLEIASGMFLKHLAGEFKLPELEKDQRRVSYKDPATGTMSERIIVGESDTHYFTHLFFRGRLFPFAVTAINKNAVEVLTK